MCKFSSKSAGVPFQPLGDLTWNDPCLSATCEPRTINLLITGERITFTMYQSASNQ